MPKGARLAQVTSLDLVRRVFARDRPNELWLTDITEHPTREGKVYCCVHRAVPDDDVATERELAVTRLTP